MILARMCPSAHANPPHLWHCWDCGAVIGTQPQVVSRPTLGTMHISNGDVLELDHSLIISRQPSVTHLGGGTVPRLIQDKSVKGDILRSHVEVRLEGWDARLVDLDATNGTVLVRESRAPRRLSRRSKSFCSPEMLPNWARASLSALRGLAVRLGEQTR